MRRVELNTIPEPDSSKKPYCVPANSPLARSEDADISYVCGECETVLAELPFQTSLGAVLSKLDELKESEKSFDVVQCPDCGEFNEFPHSGNNPKENEGRGGFESNLEELLQQTRLTNRDFGPEGHYVDPDVHILNNYHEIYELEYPELLELPRYISDAVLRCSPPRVTQDHFLYWGWTAAYLSEHPKSEQENFEKLAREFFSLIHVMLFKIRHINSRIFYTRAGITTPIEGEMISWEDAWKTIEWGNPSLRHLTVLPDRYATTTGFAVLEALICHHSKHLTNEGKPSQDVRSPWRPPDKELLRKGESISYHDRLQIWRHYDAQDETADSLAQINDLTRYDTNNLSSNIEGVEDIIDEETRSTQNFLRVLADQRNSNLHGQLHTRIMGTLVTSLCCLLIWDLLPQDDFEKHRDAVKEKIYEQSDEAFDNVMSAPAFMPVDRVQEFLDVDFVTPKDPRYPERFREYDYE